MSGRGRKSRELRIAQIRDVFSRTRFPGWANGTRARPIEGPLTLENPINELSRLCQQKKRCKCGLPSEEEARLEPALRLRPVFRLRPRPSLHCGMTANCK